MTQPREPTEANQALTGRVLTEAERVDAIKALRVWFIQNDISAQEGALIMIELMSACLVDKTTDLPKLTEAVRAFHLGLIYSVALNLKAKAKQ